MARTVLVLGHPYADPVLDAKLPCGPTIVSVDDGTRDCRQPRLSHSRPKCYRAGEDGADGNMLPVQFGSLEIISKNTATSPERKPFFGACGGLGSRVCKCQN